MSAQPVEFTWREPFSQQVNRLKRHHLAELRSIVEKRSGKLTAQLAVEFAAQLDFFIEDYDALRRGFDKHRGEWASLHGNGGL